MIKKTLLKSWLLLLCMVVGVGTAWADEVTYTFTSRAWAATSGGSEADWTSGKDGAGFSNNGIQVTTSVTGANGTSPVSFSNISEIVLTYNTNKSKGAGSAVVKIGDNDAVSKNWGYLTGDGTSANYTLTYSYETPQSGNVKITLNTTTNSIYLVSCKITYNTSGGGGSSAVATTTAIDAKGITNTDIYSGTAAGSLSAAVTVTEGGAAIDGATVTWSGDNDAVATINASTGAVTLVAAGTVTFTATYAGVEDEYNASSNTYELTVTDSTPIPTHTVTFSVNGATTTDEVEEGAAIEFPANPADVSGKTFVGWVAEAIEGTMDEAPEFVTTAIMGESNITYYAVFAEVIPGTANTFTDVMTTATFGSPSSYTDWSGKQAENGSSAVYAGHTTTSATDAIQMRTNNNNSGIVSTTSGGKVKKVVVTWDSSTASGRKLDIYGSNKAYTSATDLYAKDTQGTLLSSLEHTTNSKSELTIDGDYEYIGIRSNNGALYLTNISIEWLSGTPDTYASYCTTVVAAAVERPVITLGANPFTHSTSVTITCETENAAIKYSFDDETWNDYSSPFAIDATTTIYAKAIKDEKESAVASVTATKNLIVPTVDIDNSGITNTDVYVGTEAGSLAATVIYEEAVQGAVVTWSGSNDEVATIDAETGVVTLVAAGTVTFTATYAGNSDYAEKTATYEMTVTNSDPNVPGTENNPYTVAQAIAYIGTLGSATSATEVFVSGIISQVDSYNSKYGSITYWISDDGTTEGQMEVYSGLNVDGEQFSAKEDLQVGDIVTVKGYVKMYNSSIPEFDKNNQIVSFERPASTEPVIAVSPVSVNVTAAEKEGTVAITFENLTISDASDFEMQFYDNEENQIDAPEWIVAEVTENNGDYAISYIISANESTDARTTYFKVYAMDDETNLVYSDLVTVAQAGFVIDYATLPFDYDGNAQGTLPAGLTQSGLGTYANSPKMKFDGTDDELVLKINEAPGSLFFDIKGNSFSEGTFTVQTSVDGVEYTDLKAYTDLGATQTEIFNLNADVRYIKWVYTEKVNGNVALGNIKVSANAAITIGAAKYATFSNNRATNFGETGITVYTAKVNGNYVTLTEVEDGIVPANTGVVLFSETAKTYEVPFTTTENSLENNDLLISDGTIAGDGSTIFALANKNQGVGFYRVANEVAVPAGTPYLTIEAAAREFFGFGSETTSINGALSIKNGASVDAPVYNLNGQRILKPAKGLYIVNGKKAVIK